MAHPMFTVPDTIPDDFLVMPGVDEADLTSEDRRIPCAMASTHGMLWDECKSNGEKPASWFITHENGKSQCSVPICEDCCSHIQHWIATCIVRSGPHGFGCRICHYGPFHYREFVTREM
jgi:hypothetical protein